MTYFDISFLQATIKELEDMNADIRMMVDMAKDMLSEALTFLQDARRSYLVNKKLVLVLKIIVIQIQPKYKCKFPKKF